MQLPLLFYRLIFRRQPVGFLYHVVATEPLPHIRHLYPYKNPGMFEADLAYTKANFQVISYDQLLESRRVGRKLPPNSAILSFDDGLAECYSIVRPLLSKYGLPCTFFICTDVIDNRQMLYRHRVSLCIEKMCKVNAGDCREIYDVLSREFNNQIDSIDAFTRWIKSLSYLDQEVIDTTCRLLDVNIDEYLQIRRPYMTADEIRTLASEGFTIGAHTKGHPKLRLLQPDEVEAEVVSSCNTIASMVNKDQVPFAFPFNTTGMNRDLLDRIAKQNPSVGHYFDAKGLMQESWIFNRLILDRPFPRVRGSDIPFHLRKAYAEVYGIRHLFSPLTYRHLGL